MLLIRNSRHDTITQPASPVSHWRSKTLPWTVSYDVYAQRTPTLRWFIGPLVVSWAFRVHCFAEHISCFAELICQQDKKWSEHLSLGACALFNEESTQFIPLDQSNKYNVWLNFILLHMYLSLPNELSENIYQINFLRLNWMKNWAK